MHAAKNAPRFLAAPSSYGELFGQFWEPETDLSLCAVSTASEAWTTFSSMEVAKSPRIDQEQLRAGW